VTKTIDNYPYTL